MTANFELAGIKAIAFDAFGTLLQIGDRRGPYRRLQGLLQTHGRRPAPDDAVTMMTLDVGLSGLSMHFGCDLPASALAGPEHDLLLELASIRLFRDAAPAIHDLRRAGYRVGVCSNLAAPYGVAVKLLLPMLDGYSLSYEVGCVKPDPGIYEHMCRQLGCDRSELLFIGDQREADFHGPQRAGIRALHLDRSDRRRNPDALSDLGVLWPLLAL